MSSQNRQPEIVGPEDELLVYGQAQHGPTDDGDADAMLYGEAQHEDGVELDVEKTVYGDPQHAERREREEDADDEVPSDDYWTVLYRANAAARELHERRGSRARSPTPQKRP